MKLTIIVPVYNMRPTLRRCIDSVLCDRFRDYQLILVDDGSDDGSDKLCDDYAARDHRVQVIHKRNGGLSDARNAGLGKAHGEYVTFVDADDTIATNTLADLMQLLAIRHEYDILEYPVYVKYGSPDKQHLLRFAHHEYHDMEDYWLHAHAYDHSYACNKIYRRELFGDVRFPTGKVFEDMHTLPRLLRHCNVVATTDVGLYYYHSNQQGITARADGNALASLLDAHLQVMRHWCDARYYSHVLNIQLDVYELTGAEPRLKPLGSKCDASGETKKVKLSRLIGIRRLCQLTKLMHKTYRRSR